MQFISLDKYFNSEHHMWTSLHEYILHSILKNFPSSFLSFESFCWNDLSHSLKGVNTHLEIQLPDTWLDTATGYTRATYSRPVQCAVEAELRCSLCLSSQNSFAPLLLQIPLWYNFVPHIIHWNIFQFSLTAQYAKISNHTFHLLSLIYVL